jgi:hypothetical protein
MLRAFLWPNYSDGDQLAREFFDKAKKGVALLGLPYESAICLCSQGGKSFVLALVQCPESDKSNMHEALKDYLLVKCGCPKWQINEGPYLGEEATVDNIAPLTAQAGIAIIEGFVVRFKKD